MWKGETVLHAQQQNFLYQNLIYSVIASVEKTNIISI